MTCPNCHGAGELKGDDYHMQCWVCNSTGLVHPERWRIVKQNLKLGERIAKQNAAVTPITGGKTS